MSRLTKKDYKEWVYAVGTTINQKASEHLNYINHKLGKLEDLEDELGCLLDVVTSKKAMIVKDNQIYEVDIMAVSFTNGKIYFGSEYSFTIRKIKDYKKTWWLKGDLEVLENDNNL